MKVIKAKIKVDQSSGNTTYIYPRIWQDNKERIPAIFYPQDRTDQVSDGIYSYQIIYPVVPDDVYVQMLADHPEIFSVADQVEFQTFSDKHHPARDVITNNSEVILTLAKSVRALVASAGLITPVEIANAQPNVAAAALQTVSITQADMDLLDPAIATRGIVRGKTSMDIINDYGATF